MSPSTPGSSSRVARNGLVAFLTLVVIAGLVWGIKQLGDATRRDIASRDRYTVHFGDIECDAPPGLVRITFLAEVRYHSKFPQTFQSIDPELPPKLTAAFAAHPWVEQVESVSIEPDNRVRVDLKFRRPALAVTIAGAKDSVRVVDTNGVLLPLGAEAKDLPVLRTPVLSPTTPSGQPWPDETVKRAVELVQAHHPRLLEKPVKGWRLTMSDGKTLLVEK